MVDSEQIQDGGMQVVNMDLVLYSSKSEGVGFAVENPASDAATGHPYGKSPVVAARSRPHLMYGH